MKSFLKENAVLLCVLTCVLLFYFYDVAFLGKTFKLTTANPQTLMTGPYGQEHNKPKYFPVHSTDVPVFEEGLMTFIKDSLRKGILPLWNPHQACGTPLVGMMHTGIFYPLNLILYLLPDLFAWDILIFVRFLLSGIFTYWFMRVMKFKRIPSLGAALAFMISAPMVFVQWSTVHVDLLLPLLLLTIERLIRKPTARRAGHLAAVVALSCFAGNPEHVFLMNAYGFSFFCFRFIAARPGKKIWQTLTLMACAYVLAAGLAAAVLLPFLQNWISEFWHAHTKYIGAMPEGANMLDTTLVNFVIPHFFQKAPVTMDFVRTTFWGYIGIIPLGLVVFSLLKKQKRGLNYFFSAAAILIFTKSYVNFPLTNWIGLLPVFRDCRFVHHTQHLFAFSIAVLVGMGLRQASSSKKNLRIGLFYAGCLTALISFAFVYYSRNVVYAPPSLKACVFGSVVLLFFLCALFLHQQKLLRPKAFPVLLTGALALEIFFYIPQGVRANRLQSFPDVPYIEFLKNHPARARSYGVFWTFYPNTASGYHVDDFGIVDGLLPKRYVRFVNEFIRPGYFDKDKTTSAFWIMPFTFSADASPYFDLANVRYTIAPTILAKLFPPAARPDFPRPVYAREVNIYEHPNALPRAFIVHKAVFAADEKTAVEIMKKIKDGFDMIAVLQHDPVPEISAQIKDSPLKSASLAAITSYAPNETVIEADMKAPGFVILSDGYHPDWKAYVNDEASPVFLANTLLRAVFLPAGKHTVRFRFEPISFYIGTALTILSLVVLGLIVWRGRNQRTGV